MKDRERIGKKGRREGKRKRISREKKKPTGVRAVRPKLDFYIGNKQKTLGAETFAITRPIHLLLSRADSKLSTGSQATILGIQSDAPGPGQVAGAPLPGGGGGQRRGGPLSKGHE